ncbi:hypothetical protein [Cellulomonas sp. URHB0016]
MGVLSDLTDAVEAYPHEYLTLDIVQVDPPGVAVNAGDDVLFRIQVANSGPLDADELSLLVEGLNGTEVKSNGAAAQWGDSFEISGTWFGTVPAHSADSPVVSGGNKFHFKPSTSSTSVRDLVRVSVLAWETDFGHITSSHSRADTEAEDTYSSTVAAA